MRHFEKKTKNFWQSGIRFFILVLLISLVITSLVPSQAQAWRRYYAHGWYGPGFNYGAWRGGFWYHGPYLDHYGWWWVVGPTWYYYPGPVYPYPSVDMEPGYIVTVNSPPPPPTSALTVRTATPTAPQAKDSSGHSNAYSYYCEQSHAYYPMTRACDGGWLATPVQAPP